MKWEVSESRGCNTGDGEEETSQGAMLCNGGSTIFQKKGVIKIDLGGRSPWWSGRQEGRPTGRRAPSLPEAAHQLLARTVQAEIHVAVLLHLILQVLQHINTASISRIASHTGQCLSFVLLFILVF